MKMANVGTKALTGKPRRAGSILDLREKEERLNLLYKASAITPGEAL
jgi:hypothetical protein